MISNFQAKQKISKEGTFIFKGNELFSILCNHKKLQDDRYMQLKQYRFFEDNGLVYLRHHRHIYSVGVII